MVVYVRENISYTVQKLVMDEAERQLRMKRREEIVRG